MQVNSFVGCINSISINRDTFGFEYVQIICCMVTLIYTNLLVEVSAPEKLFPWKF